MMKFTLALLVAASSHLALSADPVISKITNAALPSVDSGGLTFLKPRSMATIFGSNLSSGTGTATNGNWVSTLAGVELHITIGAYTVCATPGPHQLACEFTADLIYVSPGQINFVVPDVNALNYGQIQLSVGIVLVKDGVRNDFSGCGVACRLAAGFTISPNGDYALFGVGFDCLYSLSSQHPEACGLSNTFHQYGTSIGAISDSRGGLITSANPVRQGELITLWMTGIGPLVADKKAGLLQQVPIKSITFSIISYGSFSAPGFFQTYPLWAGESPQFVGLDQIDVVMPSCAASPATEEKRVDANMSFGSVTSIAGGVTLTFPLLIAKGDPDCQFQGIK